MQEARMVIEFLDGVLGFLATYLCFVFAMCFVAWGRRTWLKNYIELQGEKNHQKLLKKKGIAKN
jgi:hypothetical protein